MGVKGDKWRGGWTPQYAENHNKIFGEKMRTTPEMYLQMWLSEQIPTNEWLRILEEMPGVREIYNKHMTEMKNE